MGSSPFLFLLQLGAISISGRPAGQPGWSASSLWLVSYLRQSLSSRVKAGHLLLAGRPAGRLERKMGERKK